MYKLAILFFSIVMMVPAAFAAETTAAANENDIFIPGRFMSLATAADGSIYLLTDANQVVCVNPDRSQKTITLPMVMESKAGDRFCDLAVSGNTLAFCGFPFPVVFSIDLGNPVDYKIIRASDQEAASLHLMNISIDQAGWRVRDADGLVFQLADGKPLLRLPEFATLEADEGNKAVLMPPPRNENGVMITGRVQKEDGRPLWVAPVPEAPRQVMSVDFLGFDNNGRHVFVVMTASGELDSEFTAYAVRRGKVVASGQIPGPAGLEMQRFYRLAPDGSIVYAQAGENNNEKGIVIKRLQLNE